MSGRVSPPGERVSVDHAMLCWLICEATRLALATDDVAIRAAAIAVIDDIVVLPFDAPTFALGDADGDVPEAER